ncbi:MAG: polysaccharide biosynthesis protein, partial [Pedobacter sp.]
MSAIKRFLGQAAIYGVTTVVSRMFNFILTPFFTTVFQPGVYSIFTKMYASASLVNAILAFGMESTFFRYLNKHEDKKQEVYNNSFLCITFLSSIFLITGLIFARPLALHFATEPGQVADYVKYVQYFIWLLFIDAICVIPFAKIRADERPMRYSMIKFLNIGTFIALNLTFLWLIPALVKSGGSLGNWCATWYHGNWVGYVFISNLTASVLTLVLLLPEFLKLQLKFDKVLFAKMVSYSWPILVANLSFVINENLDK